MVTRSLTFANFQRKTVFLASWWRLQRTAAHCWRPPLPWRGASRDSSGNQAFLGTSFPRCWDSEGSAEACGNSLSPCRPLWPESPETGRSRSSVSLSALDSPWVRQAGVCSQDSPAPQRSPADIFVSIRACSNSPVNVRHCTKAII